MLTPLDGETVDAFSLNDVKKGDQLMDTKALSSDSPIAATWGSAGACEGVYAVPQRDFTWQKIARSTYSFHNIRLFRLRCCGFA